MPNHDAAEGNKAARIMRRAPADRAIADRFPSDLPKRALTEMTNYQWLAGRGRRDYASTKNKTRAAGVA